MAWSPKATRSNSCASPASTYDRRWPALIIDLRALQTVGVIHVHRLPFGVEIQRGESRFAMAVARVLGAAKREVGFGADGGRVDVDDARFQITLGAERLIDVARVDRSRKTVLHAVGDGDGVVKRIERHHRDDRAENLLLADTHLRVAIGEDGRLVEPALRV